MIISMQMMKKIFIATVFVLFCGISATIAQQNPWRKGIVTDEFIYEKAPYPECHAATIAETAIGIVAAWFGGTKERNLDVFIWLSRKAKNGNWTIPINVT